MVFIPVWPARHWQCRALTDIAWAFLRFTNRRASDPSVPTPGVCYKLAVQPVHHVALGESCSPPCNKHMNRQSPLKPEPEASPWARPFFHTATSPPLSPMTPYAVTSQIIITTRHTQLRHAIEEGEGQDEHLFVACFCLMQRSHRQY